MPRSDEPRSIRRFDLPVWLLAAWVALFGTLYARAMAAERGRDMLAPIAAIAEKLGLSRQ